MLKSAFSSQARGWTEQQVQEVVARPPIGTSMDNRGGRNDPASVYGSRSGGYVVVNDITGQVVQISDRTNPAWIPDRRINWNETMIYTESNDFFRLDGNATMILSRNAATGACLGAANQALLIVRIEGGIWHDGKFEARLDAIWDGLDPPVARDEAHKNNLRAVEFIKSMETSYNAFVLTSASISG